MEPTPSNTVSPSSPAADALPLPISPLTARYSSFFSWFKYLPPLMALMLAAVLVFVSSPGGWKGWFEFEGLSSPMVLAFFSLSILELAFIFLLTAPNSIFSRILINPLSRKILPLAMSELPILLGFAAAFTNKTLGDYLPFVFIGAVGYALAVFRNPAPAN